MASKPPAAVLIFAEGLLTMLSTVPHRQIKADKYPFEGIHKVRGQR
ncbi:MAG: hypothetical protein ACJAT3_002713 [Akkermansiaceae bacterium]|jgi:hypothetical protein